MKNRIFVLVLIAFATLYLVWGSTYLVISFALESFPPFFLGGARFLIAGFLMLGICLFRRHEIPSLRDIWKTSISGILMLSMGVGAVIWAEQYLPSGVAAIIPATIPLWLIILDRKNWEEHFSNWFLLVGLIIGFMGVVLLVSNNVESPGSAGEIGLISFLVLIAGAISWSAGTLYTKYNQAKGSTGIKASIQMVAAGCCSLLVSGFFGEFNVLATNTISSNAIWSLLYLVVMGSIAAYFAYVWLINIKPAAIVGTYVYVNPGVALVLGWLFANEPLSSLQLVAFGVILIGLLLVNLSKDRSVKVKSLSSV